MRILLDTATFLWFIVDAPELSRDARAEIARAENDVFLSAVSSWEIAVKHGLGRLPLPDPPERYIPRQRKRHGIAALPLDEEAALQLPCLPALHRDPFDRMLVCQAIAHGLVIATSDAQLTRYPVRTIW